MRLKEFRAQNRRARDPGVTTAGGTWNSGNSGIDVATAHASGRGAAFAGRTVSMSFDHYLERTIGSCAKTAGGLEGKKVL